MKILVIDNHIDRSHWGAVEICRTLQHAQLGLTIQVRRGPERDLPKTPQDFDAIVVSGSRTSALANAPWIEELLAWIRTAIEMKKPYLGICYGHQLLSRALAPLTALQTPTEVPVRKAAQPEWGWVEIHTLQSHPLFKGLSSSFWSFAAHFEEVSTLLPGMKTLANSQNCHIQVCQWKELPVFGLQFHPEKTQHEAQQCLQKEKARHPNLPILKQKVPQNAGIDQVGALLLKNFFNQIYPRSDNELSTQQ